jgi:hypothetical protein
LAVEEDARAKAFLASPLLRPTGPACEGGGVHIQPGDRFAIGVPQGDALAFAVEGLYVQGAGFDAVDDVLRQRGDEL